MWECGPVVNTNLELDRVVIYVFFSAGRLCQGGDITGEIPVSGYI